MYRIINGLSTTGKYQSSSNDYISKVIHDHFLQHNKQHHWRMLPTLNDHTSEFHPQTQKLEPHFTVQLSTAQFEWLHFTMSSLHSTAQLALIRMVTTKDFLHRLKNFDRIESVVGKG